MLAMLLHRSFLASFLATLVTSGLMITPAKAAPIEWVRVANPGNAADTDLPPLNSTTSRERIWGWSKPREATNATRKEGTG